MVGEASFDTFPTPRREPIANLAVSHGAVAADKNLFLDRGRVEVVGAIGVDAMPDGSVLIWVPSGGFMDCTALLLQIRIRGDECTVQSCHLRWAADIPPWQAWRAIERGSITLECPRAGSDSQLGVSFTLESSSAGGAVSGSFHTSVASMRGGVPAFAAAHLAALTQPP
jgi:hypothetical protein